MKNFLLIILVFALSTAAAYFVFSKKTERTSDNQIVHMDAAESVSETPQSLQKEKLSIKRIIDGVDTEFEVEMATTPEEQKIGMMFRDDVPPLTGMLFVFADEKERNFWMKNCRVPLDIIFIEKSGIIHNIHENAEPNSEENITSNGNVMAVLEIAGGEAQRLGIDVGDIVYHPAFSGVDKKELEIMLGQ